MDNLSLRKEEAIEDFESLLHSTISNDLSSEIENIIEETRRFQFGSSSSSLSSSRGGNGSRHLIPKVETHTPVFKPSASLPSRLDFAPKSPGKEPRSLNRQTRSSGNPNQPHRDENEDMLANVNSRVEILETQLSSFIEGFKEMLESDGVGVDNLFKNPSAPTASSKKPAKEKIVGRHQSCACASVKRELDALKKKKTIGERDATVSASVKEYVRKEIKRSEKDLLEEVISPLIAQELVDFEYRLKGLAHGQDRDSGFISPTDWDEPWKRTVVTSKEVSEDSSEDIHMLLTKLQRKVYNQAQSRQEVRYPNSQLPIIPLDEPRPKKTLKGRGDPRQHYARPTLASALKSKRYPV